MIREIVLGAAIATIFWMCVLGVQTVNHRREVRNVEDEAYLESYKTKQENLRLRKEIRWLYNSKRKEG